MMLQVSLQVSPWVLFFGDDASESRVWNEGYFFPEVKTQELTYKWNLVIVIVNCNNIVYII